MSSGLGGSDQLPGGADSNSKPYKWTIAVSAVLLVWLAAQAIAGVKFAKGATYPIVGSGMFNSPPIAGSKHYLAPRVFATTDSGAVVELDQSTFFLEPFEWRRWLNLNVEEADSATALRTMRDLADTYEATTGVVIVSFEVWRIQALTDERSKGYLVGKFEV